MKKYLCLLLLLGILDFTSAKAQYGGVIIGGGYYRRPYPPRPHRPYYQRQEPRQRMPQFKPSVNVSLGYGFPNLDKDQFVSFQNMYQGTVSQKGPFTGAMDFQFSRSMSIGVMGSYGKVSVPYYDYLTGIPAATGSLENWSVMLNLMNYIPTYDKHVQPYFRTAIGINNWEQNYVDSYGNKAADIPEPSQFAYQVSIGSKFMMSDNAGLFLEAGYGKYIVSGGFTFKF